VLPGGKRCALGVGPLPSVSFDDCEYFHFKGATLEPKWMFVNEVGEVGSDEQQWQGVPTTVHSDDAGPGSC